MRFFSNLFSYILGVMFFPEGEIYVSHPYKTGDATVSGIIILNGAREDKVH